MKVSRETVMALVHLLGDVLLGGYFLPVFVLGRPTFLVAQMIQSKDIARQIIFVCEIREPKGRRVVLQVVELGQAHCGSRGG